MNTYSKFILEKDVLLTEYSPIYAREYLTSTNPSAFTYGVPSKTRELDKVDVNILRIISKNARISEITSSAHMALRNPDFR